MAVQLLELIEAPDLPHRLGRHVEHDDRSRDFDARRLARRAVRPVLWPRYSPIFGQGKVGGCTGMAQSGILGCAPWCGDPLMFGINEAFWLYAGATRNDAFPGWWPQEDTGSSPLAAAKTARDLGMIKGWATAFATADMVNALMHGPVVWGTVWTEAMFDPEPDGRVRPLGAVAGGHAFVCRGYDPSKRQFLCDNSWNDDGTVWGPLGGSFLVDESDWETLRVQDADVTVMIL